MRLTFWGTRGSIPSPGRGREYYGGNTTCVELITGSGTQIIIDAGTGIRELGNNMLKNKIKAKDSYFLLTHFHWDHIQGLPFFVPAYITGNSFTVMGVEKDPEKLKEIISGQMKIPYFPVGLDTMQNQLVFKSLFPYGYDLNGTKVYYTLTNHPQETLAFKFEENGKTITFMTDCELNSGARDAKTMEFFASFCKNSDYLIVDSQFTEEELPNRFGWGHSSNMDALKLAEISGSKTLILFHHDPAHNDDFIDKMVRDVVSAANEQRLNINCFAARDYDSIST
ncbi:MAG: MBL fold metallo-hydrolase [Deltaproteobacteria bacterium]|nr:MBL fold metallo-hydrolase [Deltaproteobacteria bacterium]